MKDLSILAVGHRSGEISLWRYISFTLTLHSHYASVADTRIFEHKGTRGRILDVSVDSDLVGKGK